MRIWTLSPEYLDAKGLVALWRETLLAQKCLKKETKGYQNHPQLNRFKETEKPVESIGYYLFFVFKEAQKRNYNFNLTKIDHIPDKIKKIKVTDQQLLYEWKHFLNKIEIRDPQLFKKFNSIVKPKPHPFFEIIDGPIEPWEIITKKIPMN